MKQSSFSIIVLFIALALTGCLVLPMLSVRLYPSRELPSLSVYFSMPGYSSRLIEQEVTCQLEGALARINGTKGVYSHSGNGWGTVNIEVDSHTDINMVRLEASSIIRQLWNNLPPEVSYPSISVSRVNNMAGGPFMSYIVSSSLDAKSVESYLNEKVIPVLSDISGIESVQISGVVPREYHLRYSPDIISLHGISTNDIINGIRQYFQHDFIGTTEMDGKHLSILITSDYNQKSFRPDLIPLVSQSGEVIMLNQVASLEQSKSASNSLFRINGLNSIYLNISSAKGANQLDVRDRVIASMEDIKSSAKGKMTFKSAKDDTVSVRNELHKIYFRTALTLLILMAFVILLSRNLKYTLLICTTLAINLAINFIFYWIFDIEIHIYTLAAITISLNIIIDNTIVMYDHYVAFRNRKVYLAILAATLTTIGALLAIYTLNESVRINLDEFIVVIIINLAVSLAIAFFLVPSLVIHLHCTPKSKSHIKRSTSPAFRLAETTEQQFWTFYQKYIIFSQRWKWLFIAGMVCLVGSTAFLFFRNVVPDEYFTQEKGETVVCVNLSLPHGATLDQAEYLVSKMEAFLSLQTGVREFQTNVSGGERASITVYFKKDISDKNYQLNLKSKLIEKALTLGGATWNIYGVEKDSFSNELKEQAGTTSINIYGYNYDELWKYCEEIRDSLSTYRRVKNVEINSEYSFWKNDHSEYVLSVNREALAINNLTVHDLYGALQPILGTDIQCGEIPSDNGGIKLKLYSEANRKYDVWGVMNVPLEIGNKTYKLSEFTTLEKSQSPQDIVKENQSYRLCVQYEYVGAFEQSYKLLTHIVESFSKRLPLGYTIEKSDNSFHWNQDGASIYWCFLVVVIVIFIISGVLFNSLTRPLIIIAMIPLSYVGIFLTFLLFDIKYDQGGFASFILLSGLTVNAAIYIITEYDILVKERTAYAEDISDMETAGVGNFDLYLEAFRRKIGPIFLTVVSTVLGFVPFLIATVKESFWYSMAAGIIGGLTFSILVLVLFLPVLILRKSKSR